MKVNFNMRWPSIKDKKKMLDWMKVGRIYSKTVLHISIDKYADIESKKICH